MPQGNFVPFAGREGPFEPTLPSRVAPAQPISCNGSPEGQVPGNPGQTCVDILTSDIYTKFQGTSKLGWIKVGTGAGAPGGGGGGGGGGSRGIFTSSGNPNGQVSATGAALCYDSSVTPANIWIKTTQGTSSTDWVLLIGG